MLVQAGQSDRGLAFGTKHGEALFIGLRSLEEATAKTKMIRDMTEAHGRPRNSIKLMQGVCLIIGETEAEAKKKYEDYLSHASPEGALALFGGWTGIDLAGVPYDSVLGNMDSDGMQFLARWFNSDDPNGCLLYTSPSPRD